MNPALVLLLLACWVPWWVRRRPATLAWGLFGVAALVLLLPALVLPDGIPSPSATLERLAPWQGDLAGPGGKGEPPPALGLDDVTFQVEPWLLFLRSELRAGRLPFWNPHQSAGAPYWANGSSAPLFPLHLLFALLPAQLGFVLLPWLRIVIGALGAWWLARELGLEERPALLAGLVYSLSGRLVAFLLYPMANALCLVPWIFLATEKVASRQRGWRCLAALAGLQLSAGHPETAVMTGLLTTVYLLVRVSWRATGLVGVWGRFVSAWAVGGALSAVLTLPLAHFLFASTRWAAWQPADPMTFPLAGRLALRFFFPDAWGHPVSGDFWGPYNFVSTTLYCGALVLPLALAGAMLERRDRRFLALSAMTLFALLGAFRLPPVEPLLLVLPVLKKGLHHYLAFGFCLGFALLAAAGVARWSRGGAGGARVPLLAGTLLSLAAVASGWLVWGGEWAARGQTGRQVGSTLISVLLLAALLGAAFLSSTARKRLLPVLLSLAAIDLLWVHHRSNAGLSAERLYPVTGAVAELSGRPERVTAPGFVLRPNAAMVYGLYDVRGDDSLKLASYEQLYGGELGSLHPTFFRPMQHWESHWLDRLGVRWVVAGPRASSPAPGARLAYEGPDARIWERPGAQPLVRWQGSDSGARLEVLTREAGHWRIEWSTPRPARLVIAEAFAPGWRARVGERPVALEAYEGALMAVDLAPGEGVLTLRYRPPGLGWGSALSLLGLLALVLGGRLGLEPPD